MEKRILLAAMLTVAIAAFLSIYWLLEPHRVKVEAEKMKWEAAGKGRKLYLTHCVRCHGEAGGPQKRIRAINSKKYLETVNDSILYKIIERGIPKTGMAALGEKEGGPLNPEQINDSWPLFEIGRRRLRSTPRHSLLKSSRCSHRKRPLT